MSWDAVYKCASIGLVLLVLIGVACAFLPQIQQYREYQRRKVALETAIEYERKLANDLSDKQKRFQTDPRFVERIAHDRGLAKPNEYIFTFTNEVKIGETK